MTSTKTGRSRVGNRIRLWSSSASVKSATMMLVLGLGLLVVATLQPTTAVGIEKSSSAGVGASSLTIAGGSVVSVDAAGGGGGASEESDVGGDGVINHENQNKNEESAVSPGEAEAAKVPTLSIVKRSPTSTTAPPAYDSDFLGELISFHAEINVPKEGANTGRNQCILWGVSSSESGWGTKIGMNERKYSIL